MNQSNFCTPKT